MKFPSESAFFFPSLVSVRHTSVAYLLVLKIRQHTYVSLWGQLIRIESHTVDLKLHMKSLFNISTTASMKNNSILYSSNLSQMHFSPHNYISGLDARWDIPVFNRWKSGLSFYGLLNIFRFVWVGTPLLGHESLYAHQTDCVSVFQCFCLILILSFCVSVFLCEF